MELSRSVDALELHRRALLQDITLAPGHLFATQPDFAHFLRINYGHPPAGKLERALQVVGTLAKELMGTR